MSHPVIEALKAYEPELVGLRHDLHQHPETAFEETRTAAVVAGKLREWGIDVAEGIARTGVVGTLKGRRPGQRAIALRADLDALNIIEETGAAYASQTPGKMHACGHDGHCTMLLGAAHYLAEHPDFGGTVHFIFQPAEEGLGGGRVMVEEGLFERFPVDAVYGLHNHPGLEVGKFQTRVGAFMAASDSWTVTFHGTGGHGGAGPHLATDATVAQAHFVLALQSIIGRNVPATTPAVLSVGHIVAGAWGSPNVMPSQVLVRGTARSYEPGIRDLLERRIGEVAHAMAAGQGCTATVHYERRYPPLVTHEDQTRVCARAAAALVGEDAVNDNAPLRTGAEDFSFMLQHRPGSFMFIGNGISPDGSFHNVHTPKYDFNDEILTLGAAYWVSLVQQELAV